MVTTFRLFRLLLLVSIFSYSPLFFANAFATPAAVNNNANKQNIPELPSQPVWENMEPGSKVPPKQDQDNNQNTGFVKPPPAANPPYNNTKNTKNTQNGNHKLVARITPANPAVQQGDSITFSLESNEKDLKYFWISGGTKGAKGSFDVNTANLKPGKYRVRATATNSKRQQAHASTFFTVKDTVEDTAVASPTDTNPNPESAPPVEGSDSGKTIELPTSNTATNTTKQPKENPNKNPQAFRLSISPSTIKVGPNEDIIFKSNLKSADGYTLQWKFAGKRRNTDAFEVSSGNLKPGRYLVHLTATNEAKETVKVQATLQVLSEAPSETDRQIDSRIDSQVDSLPTDTPNDNKVATPDVVGTAFSDLKQQLASQNFALGNVNERPVKEGGGYIIEQSPKAGSRILPGSVINVVVGVSSVVSVPDLFGLQKNTIRQQLAQSGLIIGEITKKINNRSIGLVLEQNPKPGSPLDRGLPVNVVIGIATPKPLKASIQPSSAIVEIGDLVELTPVIVDPEVDSELSFQWSLGDLSSTDRVFKVDTSTLSLGDHRAKLLVKNNFNQQVSAESAIKITAKTTQLPNMTGEDIDFARTTLESIGLKLGEIQKLPREVAEETVLEQSPPAGKQVTLGSSVQLVVAIPKPKEESVITLSADADEIKAGETVTLILQLSPKPENGDIHYVYTINKESIEEEKKANVRPELRWTPEKEGIYTIVVAAFNNKGILAKSSPLTVTVNPAWEMPVAKIIPEMIVIKQGDSAELVSTSTYDLNSSLNYVWSSDTGHKSVQKQFVFDTSEVTPGSYSVKLTVIDDQKNESSASTMLVVQADVNSVSSANGKTPLDVSQTPKADSHTSQSKSQSKSQNIPEIRLMATERFISVGSSTRIKVVSDRSLSNVYYYFETGDGDNTEWIPTGEIDHSYDSFGAYRVRAAIKQGEQIYYSDSLTIWVFSSLLFILMGGLALLTAILMWWWTKRIPASSSQKKNRSNAVHSIVDSPSSETTIMEQQVPLKQDDSDIVTEPRRTQTLNTSNERTVASVIKRAILQFILGILLSVLAIYLILKAMGLV